MVNFPASSASAAGSIHIAESSRPPARARTLLGFMIVSLLFLDKRLHVVRRLEPAGGNIGVVLDAVDMHLNLLAREVFLSLERKNKHPPLAIVGKILLGQDFAHGRIVGARDLQQKSGLLAEELSLRLSLL